MKIVVLGGSPKGAKSGTMQYVNYIKMNATEHTFIEHYIASEIHSIEFSEGKLQRIADDIRNADTVLWAFPLYFGLVHGSYKRFIELIWEKDIKSAFEGKHCAILATSIHFFDHTATEYIRGISEDLGMIVDEIYSPGSEDLLGKNGTKNCDLFFKQWMKKIDDDVNTGRLTSPVDHRTPRVSFSGEQIFPVFADTKLGLVTESGISENLDAMVNMMIGRFERSEIFDLSKMKIAGGCHGCLKCAYNNQCVYEGKDDVIDTYRKLKECDVIVFAGTIKDRYLSAKWKTFIDRQFFSTHVPFLDGKVLGFIISGPLRQIPSLRELLTGSFEANGLTIGGIVTDEGQNTAQQIHGLASSLRLYYKNDYHPPVQFLGKAGQMIFRDTIFGGLKGVFVADHKYYKRNRLYDFPHKNWRKRIFTNVLYVAMRVPSFRRKVQRDMADYIVRPYEKVIEKENNRK